MIPFGHNFQEIIPLEALKSGAHLILSYPSGHKLRSEATEVQTGNFCQLYALNTMNTQSSKTELKVFNTLFLEGQVN